MIEKTVGELVELDTKIQPEGIQGTNWQWSFESEVIGGYTKEEITGNRWRAYTTEVTTDEDNVQFHWVEDGYGLEVTVSCIIGGETVTDTIEFFVRGLALLDQTSSTGTVDVYYNELRPGSGGSGDRGVECSVEIGAQASLASGYLKFVQLLNGDLQRTKTDNSTESWQVPELWLDNEDPYSTPIPISSAQTREISFDDTPGVPLNTDYKKMEIDPMDFVVYIMYKSNSEGSIWVPVAKMDWGWQAIAESSDGGNTWSKTSGAHTNTNPSFSQTTEFAEYDDTVAGTEPFHPVWEEDE